MARSGGWRKTLLWHLPWRLAFVGVVLFACFYVLMSLRFGPLRSPHPPAVRQAMKEFTRLYGKPAEVQGVYLLVPFVRRVDARSEPGLRNARFPEVFACGEPGHMRLMTQEGGTGGEAMASGRNASIRPLKTADGSASAYLVEGSHVVFRAERDLRLTYVAIVEGGKGRDGQDGGRGLFCGRDRFLNFRLAAVVPQALRMTGQVDAQRVHLPGRPAAAYRAKLAFEAVFDTAGLAHLLKDADAVFWDAARFVVLVQPRALTQPVTVRLNGQPLPREGPSLFNVDTDGAVDVLVGDVLVAAGLASADNVSERVRAFLLRREAGTARLALDLALRGSRRLALLPVGETAQITLKLRGERIRHDGEPYPERMRVEGRETVMQWRMEGGTARRPWLSPPIHVDTDRPELVRQHHRWLAAALIRNELFFRTGKPIAVAFRPVYGVKDHKKRARSLARNALDYGWQILGAVLGGLLLLELVSGRRLSRMHYVFSGLMTVMFFLLFVGLFDHVRFPVAYGVPAMATGAVLAVYAWRLLGRPWAGGLLALIIAMAHGHLYVSLRLADYALLVGSVAGFVLLTIVLFTSVSMNRKASSHGGEQGP